MEAMRGPRWQSRMDKENTQFMEEVVESASIREIAATTHLFQAYSEQAEAVFTYDIPVGKNMIQITEESGGVFKWKWADSTEHRYPLAGDIDVGDSLVVYSEDVKKGGGHYTVCAVTPTKTVWTFDGRGRHGLSSDIAILGDRVYLLEAAAPLQYKWLVSVDLKTGTDRRVHYQEDDISVSLALIRGENKCLFLVADKAGREALFHIDVKGGVTRLDKDGTVFYPVGKSENSEEPCYFVRKTMSSKWEVRGTSLKRMVLPSEINGIDLVNLKSGTIVHRTHGHRHFERKGKRVFSFWGDVGGNPWLNWLNGMIELRFSIPGQTPVRAKYDKKLILEKPTSVYASIMRHGFTTSADGTAVRWLGVWNASPRALLVVGYGAYGLTTPTDTTRWRPYLENGFAIGFAFIRGGGDHNDAWADAGRVAGKEKGIEDFEACVRSLQRATGLGPSATFLFGRSAGGYLVGGAIVRNPNGELARHVYTEAPYVDVLQTASNAKLPLTPFEYLEFGDPAHNISDFEMLLRLSPIGGAGDKGVPGVFVLCRVGLTDRQVYAYESVKWMDVLRGKGLQKEKKILFITKGVGHSVHGEQVFIERAEDFLILNGKKSRD